MVTSFVVYLLRGDLYEVECVYISFYLASNLKIYLQRVFFLLVFILGHVVVLMYVIQYFSWPCNLDNLFNAGI